MSYPSAVAGAPDEGLASFPCIRDVTGKRAGRTREQVWSKPIVATYTVGTGEASVVWEMVPGEKELSEVETPPTPEDLEKNRKRASNRARKTLRQFVVRNQLSRMWTLTFSTEWWDRAEVIAVVNDWLQRLRVELEGPFPAVYVLELHPGGHGYHVHVALQSRFIRWERMGQLWGWGNVQYSDGNKAVRRETGKREQSRLLARYLSKYMAKAWDEHHEPGDHRYEVTQGFQPDKVRRTFHTLGDAWRWLEGLDTGSMRVVWSSADVPLEDYGGPPTWLVEWR